jgi:RNA polymerase sigma factor, sigma-70 family
MLLILQARPMNAGNGEKGDDPLHQKTVDETNFIRLLEKKDERALDYVIDTYGSLIKAIVHKHLYSFPDKCGECMNDILLAVWTQISHYNPEKCGFSGWLAAVSKYKAIDYKRRYYKQLTEAPLSEEETDTQGNPEESILEQEISEETQSLLQYLSEEDRTLFWDCYVKEEPMESLARERNTNVSALYNRLSRDKKKLRQCREVISNEKYL